jgi:hypothetical protein
MPTKLILNVTDDLETAVLERAKEWYVAKRAAEQNAGQPVNWTDHTFEALEIAIKNFVDEEEFVESLIS